MEITITEKPGSYLEIEGEDHDHLIDALRQGGEIGGLKIIDDQSERPYNSQYRIGLIAEITDAAGKVWRIGYYSDGAMTELVEIDNSIDTVLTWGDTWGCDDGDNHIYDLLGYLSYNEETRQVDCTRWDD